MSFVNSHDGSSNQTHNLQGALIKFGTGCVLDHNLRFSLYHYTTNTTTTTNVVSTTTTTTVIIIPIIIIITTTITTLRLDVSPMSSSAFSIPLVQIEYTHLSPPPHKPHRLPHFPLPQTQSLPLNAVSHTHYSHNSFTEAFSQSLLPSTPLRVPSRCPFSPPFPNS